jgi:hypothetical protein
MGFPPVRVLNSQATKVSHGSETNGTFVGSGLQPRHARRAATPCRHDRSGVFRRPVSLQTSTPGAPRAPGSARGCRPTLALVHCSRGVTHDVGAPRRGPCTGALDAPTGRSAVPAGAWGLKIASSGCGRRASTRQRDVDRPDRSGAPVPEPACGPVAPSRGAPDTCATPRARWRGTPRSPCRHDRWGVSRRPESPQTTRSSHPAVMPSQLNRRNVHLGRTLELRLPAQSIGVATQSGDVRCPQR